MEKVATVKKNLIRTSEMENRKLELQAKVFKVFSDPSRLRILGLLKEEEHNVSDMCKRLNLKQSTVSQHLRMLKECGVVSTKKEGREITYSIRDEKVVEILELGGQLLLLVTEDLMACVCE